MAKLTYTGAEVQSLLDKVNGISGGGGGIAYPLTWSGFSKGVWDGSAPANIAIPSLVSQLTNDSDYITSASVNSLLTDYLSKSGGTVNGNITATTFLPTDNTAIQFPDGEYIDRYGNIVLPSTASQWSVHQGSNILMNVKTNGSVGVGTGDVSLTQKFNVYGGIDIFETSGEYSGVIGLNRKSSIGGRYNPNFTAWQIQNHYGNIEFYEEGYGARIIIYGDGAALLQVHGNFLATGEITQHSSLVLKDVVDTRFLTLKELVALKPYSFRWKDGRDDKLHAGAVADYVKPILPEVISTDKDDIHSMNYANAAWVVGTSLTPYVSKHEEDIDWLKARVRYLEDKLKEC